MVLAQLVEQSLPIPEACGLNPVIDKIYIEHMFTINSIEKTKINKNRLRMAHFLKKNVFAVKWLVSHVRFEV